MPEPADRVAAESLWGTDDPEPVVSGDDSAYVVSD